MLIFLELRRSLRSTYLPLFLAARTVTRWWQSWLEMAGSQLERITPSPRLHLCYPNAQLYSNTPQLIIYGSDAHSWTQIYFAGYVWINFEPSAGFSQFVRPTPNQYLPGTSSTVPAGGLNPNIGKNHKTP